jgi:hypothetical protein
MGEAEKLKIDEDILDAKKYDESNNNNEEEKLKLKSDEDMTIDDGIM